MKNIYFIRNNKNSKTKSGLIPTETTVCMSSHTMN